MLIMVVCVSALHKRDILLFFTQKLFFCLLIHIISVSRVIECFSNGPSDVWTIPHLKALP